MIIRFKINVRLAGRLIYVVEIHHTPKLVSGYDKDRNKQTQFYIFFFYYNVNRSREKLNATWLAEREPSQLPRLLHSKAHSEVHILIH